MADYSSNKSDIDISGLTMGKAFANRMAAMKVIKKHKPCSCFRVSVEGYDTSLGADYISSVLLCCFRACGQIWNAVVSKDHANPSVAERCGVIYFLEEAAQLKAVALSGCDMGYDMGWITNVATSEGRWNVIVKALPKKSCECSPDQLAEALKHTRFPECGFTVTGYPTSLPADDVKRALFNRFSCCGKVIYLNINMEGLGVLSSCASVCIAGENVLVKAMELSGSDMGGWRVVVLPPPNVDSATWTNIPVTIGYGDNAHNIPVGWCNYTPTNIIPANKDPFGWGDPKIPIGWDGPPGYRWCDINKPSTGQ